MTELEKAEENLAKSLKSLPMETAATLVMGAMAIAFGDDGLEALRQKVCNQLECDERLKGEMR